MKSLPSPVIKAMCNQLFGDLHSYEDIKRTLEAYPRAVEKQDVYGNLLLHAACWYKASEDIIKMLFAVYPEAERVQNKFSNLPLYLALYQNASPDVIRMIFEAYPRATEVQNNTGNFPLHIVSRCSAPLDIIQMLFEAYPQAVKVQNEDGDLPLHCALQRVPCTNNISCCIFDEKFHYHNVARFDPLPDMIKLLLQEYPEAAKVKNNGGDSPLYIACSSNTPLDIIKID